MLKVSEAAVQWLWIDATTGICFPETMAATEGYARDQAQRILGKRRLGYGEVRAVRVTFSPLTDEETAQQRNAYAEWRAKKDADRAAAQGGQPGAA